MRQILLGLAVLCWLWPGTAVAKPKFPYVAYVSAEQTPLRSGPGTEHYTTDRLDRGAKVEVHRHDPGGWYAVKPISGSFSWVPARHLEMTDEADVAQVISEGVVAWVGTRDAQAKNLGWQIEFKQGDLVEVLGAKKLALAEGEEPEICYKIGPPAGEFRWIQNKHVTRRGPDELAEEGAEPQDAKSVGSADKEVQLASLLALVEGSGEKAATATNASSKAEGGAAKSDGFVPRKKRAEGGLEPSSSAPLFSAPGSVSALPTNSTIGPSTAVPGDESPFDARLRELDVELSLLVVREPAAWNLSPLRQKAVDHQNTGQTALDRGRARLLIEKIDEFADFAHRRPLGAASGSNLSATPASAEEPKKTNERRSKNLIESASAPIGSGVRGSEFAPDIDPRYDGMGWLMPVHSQTRSAPNYALLDNDGKVLQYITPSPGLNLNRYLRTQVGIYGQRGYVTHLRTPHLTAQRIVSLERHRK